MVIVTARGAVHDTVHQNIKAPVTPAVLEDRAARGGRALDQLCFFHSDVSPVETLTPLLLDVSRVFLW